MTRIEILKQIELRQTELGYYYPLLLTLFSSGARITEVINIKWSDLIPYTDVVIIGLKGSRNRRVTVNGIESYFKHCIVNRLNPFNVVSRYQVYRIIKRYGWIVDNGISKNKSVTHSARKLYIRESFKSQSDIEVVKDTIGHKSSESTKYYE
jgi:integrase